MRQIDFNAKKQAKEDRAAKFDAAFDHFFSNTTPAEQEEFFAAFRTGDDRRMQAIKDQIKARRREGGIA